MNNIEERLWNYIDGSCTPDEQQAVSSLIAADPAWRSRYNELLKLNREFSALELDEPPMAFTYNVMEGIRAELAQKPLKASINKRIILGIAAFFVLTILILLGYALSQVSLAPGNASLNVPESFKLPDVKNYLTGPVIKGFFFFDTVLALFLFDKFLRVKKSAGHA